MLKIKLSSFPRDDARLKNPHDCWTYVRAMDKLDQIEMKSAKEMLYYGPVGVLALGSFALLNLLVAPDGPIQYIDNHSTFQGLAYIGLNTFLAGATVGCFAKTILATKNHFEVKSLREDIKQNYLNNTSEPMQTSNICDTFSKQ